MTPHLRWAMSAAVLITALALSTYLLLTQPDHSAQESAFTENTGVTLAPGFVGATSTSVNAPIVGPLAPPRAPPIGEREYRSATYRFSLFYPQEFAVREYNEGSGAQTIVIQDPQEAKGLQIFVVPYGASQVSLDRFRRDEPSGVMESPYALLIDGASATLFTGEDATLGPTREVWFIHGNYLFEISAPASLDDWLAAIMRTWQFI